MLKSWPSNPSSTAKPSDQYIILTSGKQQQSPLPSQQQAKDTDRIEASQKFYSGGYNTRLPPTQHQVTNDKEIMSGDNCEAWFHYAVNPNRIKQLPPQFQQMAQEQLANQQQQQQQHLWSSSQGTTQRRDNAHTSNANFLDEVFMPKDDIVNP